MDEVAEQAKRWRDRAEMLRMVALGVDHPSAKRDLIDLAGKWEKTADDSEARSERLERARREVAVGPRDPI